MARRVFGPAARTADAALKGEADGRRTPSGKKKKGAIACKPSDSLQGNAASGSSGTSATEGAGLMAETGEAPQQSKLR